ncbi:protein unc-45 homolog B-like [Branchiostoma lanceolatum]|uniref:protein unc-45 homolog B-like n=1 Tax=Branchiostoma lanceolatum TaxID=7740 RepID=UPI003452F828
MTEAGMTEAELSKEQGNQHFKAGEYEEAISCYTQALKLSEKGDKGKAVFYKNRAACHLKLEEYQKAAADASKALDISGNDAKALFRKCQALEHLSEENPQHLTTAYKDAMQLLQMEPKDAQVRAMLVRLKDRVMKLSNEKHTTTNKVDQMLKIAFGKEESLENKRKAVSNLIVLSREEAGAQLIFREGGIQGLDLLLDHQDEEILLNALMALTNLCYGHRSRTMALLDTITLPKICKLVARPDVKVSNGATSLVQAAIRAVTGLDKVIHRGAEEAVVIDNEADLELLLKALIVMLKDRRVSGVGRDNVIDLIIKNVPKKGGLGIIIKTKLAQSKYKDGIGCSELFIDMGGLKDLIVVGGNVKDSDPSLPMTDETRMHISVCLTRIYDDYAIHDEAVRRYKDICQSTVQGLLGDVERRGMVANLEAIQALTTILHGPFDVGNIILGVQAIMNNMIAMCAVEEPDMQMIAVEAMIAAMSKKNRSTFILSHGAGLLKQIYKSESADDPIKVRALVGLSKLGSIYGSDGTRKAFAEGSTLKLAKHCRKFLLTSKERDLQRWAAEGLAYLTMDADVKEFLVDDPQTIRAIVELAKEGGVNVVYGVGTTLNNMVNGYEYGKEEELPEMKKLAKFAKQHVPEPHKLDSRDHVDIRIEKLVKEGVVVSLVALSKTESNAERELLSRIFLAITEREAHRGITVAQGGAKVLIPMANEGSDKGKWFAGQALAKIGITTNPEIAFPGQRALEMVRPMKKLLDMDASALQNFEALMALTNLASQSESVRNRIFEDSGFALIEHYMFEDHDMLKRAAIQLICNLVSSKKWLEKYQATGNDRLKYIVLLCGEDDFELVKAAAGTLAQLTTDKDMCERIPNEVKSWVDILCEVGASPLPDIQHRMMVVITNMMMASKELATKIVETKILDVVMAVRISLRDDADPTRQKVRKCVDAALKSATDFGLIKPASNLEEQQALPEQAQLMNAS